MYTDVYNHIVNFCRNGSFNVNVQKPQRHDKCAKHYASMTMIAKNMYDPIKLYKCEEYCFSNMVLIELLLL